MVFKNSIPDIEEYITMYQSENVPIQTFILICGTLYKLKKIIVFLIVLNTNYFL